MECILQLEQCSKTMVSAPEEMSKLCLLENLVIISHICDEN